jgi:hypothetical protein
MRHFYLYVFILSVIIVFFSLYTTIKSKKEAFHSISPNYNIILLGDSIFKNNLYVSSEKAIENILTKKTEGNCYCYAENNSKTYDIYSQINNIPLELDNKNTTIFLSVGGNDILDKYVERNNANINDISYLNPIFGAYKNLVKTIKTKMDKAKLVLLDLYCPPSTKYLPYKNIISEWNNKIYNYAKNNNMEVLRVSTLLTKDNDFTLEIEPSETGGEKLANAIYNYKNFYPF